LVSGATISAASTWDKDDLNAFSNSLFEEILAILLAAKGSIASASLRSSKVTTSQPALYEKSFNIVLDIAYASLIIGGKAGLSEKPPPVTYSQISTRRGKDVIMTLHR
jgi:hypothetical protein